MRFNLASFIATGLIFCGLYKALSNVMKLPHSAYERRAFVWHMLSRPTIVAFLMALVAPLCGEWNRLRWDQCNHGRTIQVCVGALCFLTIKGVVLFPGNPYFRRRYVLDRAVIVALGISTVVHPAFTGIFLGFVFAFHYQIVYPLCPWLPTLDCLRPTQPSLPLLIGVTAWLYGRLLWGADTTTLVVLMTVVHCSTYFWSAIRKVEISWPRKNHLARALTAAVAHRRWDERRERLTRVVVQTLTRWNRPLLLVTVALELSVPLLLSSNAVCAVALLLSLCMFHLFAAAITGINFRAWLGANLILAMLIVAVRNDLSTGFPVGGLLLLAVAPTLLSPLRLAWLDAPLCNVFRFVAVDAAGGCREMQPAEFGPYAIFFDRNDFKFLVSSKLVVDTWGETDNSEITEILSAASTVEAVNAVEKSFGISYYDKRRIPSLDRFMARVLSPRDTIRSVLIYLTKWHFDGANVRILSDEVVHEIALASPTEKQAPQTAPDGLRSLG